MAKYKNFSYGTVLTAPSPAASGTSLVLNSGEGARFEEGWAWVFPPATQPLSSNAEIVQITNISTDTLTIVRAQQGTSAKSIAVTWQVAQGLTRDDVHAVLNKINYAADAGASDAYSITLEPAPTSLVTGQAILVKPNTTNTGAATLDVNSIGAQAIRKRGAEVLDDGDMLAGQVSLVVWDGTNFQLLNPVNLDGWQKVTETWTRTGNHTFTVTGDLTSKYRKGTKVRYKDGGSNEYGVVGSSSYSAPNTTVTLITNTDYTMAAATITDTYISYIENPEGFPHWFSYTPTIAQGASTDISKTIVYSKFVTSGKTITYSFRVSMTAAGTGGSTVTVTVPASISQSEGVLGIGEYFDSGTASYVVRMTISTSAAVFMAAASVTATGASIGANPSLAVASGDVIQGNITYEF